MISGNPQDSLIIQALRYDGIEMPPSEPLPDSVIRDFETWIDRGAVDPRKIAPSTGSQTSSDANASLWSLKPIAES